MECFQNADFVDGKGYYINSQEFKEGFVVARAFSPRSYNENGKEISGWLPELIICEGNKDTPITIQGSSIVAKSPAKSYAVQFNPWMDEKNKDKLIYTFEGAFTHEGNVRDISSIFHNTKGYFDDQIRPGEISYSDISNRDLVLQGHKKELEDMIFLSLNNFPQRGFDLEYGEYTANGKSKYNIEIPEKNKIPFVKEVLKNLK